MYTQTIYELSQEAERLLMLSLEHLKTVKKMPTATLEGASSLKREDDLNVQPLGRCE